MYTDKRFKIDTPIGSYNPDWVVYIDKDGTEKLYFVIETKGNTNINLEMVKKGCAWNYMYYNKSLYTIFAQITAKNKKAGLWADNNPQAPWDYRKQTKQ